MRYRYVLFRGTPGPQIGKCSVYREARIAAEYADLEPAFFNSLLEARSAALTILQRSLDAANSRYNPLSRLKRRRYARQTKEILKLTEETVPIIFA